MAGTCHCVRECPKQTLLHAGAARSRVGIAQQKNCGRVAAAPAVTISNFVLTLKRSLDCVAVDFQGHAWRSRGHEQGQGDQKLFHFESPYIVLA